jgi:hypothetical protein
MKKKMLFGPLALSLLLGGCFVSIRKVSDAGPELAKARAEIQQLARTPGRAKSVEVLVYDPSDGELVRVGVPLWLARRAADEADFDLGEELGEKVEGRLRGIRLAELEKVGRGALVEVEDEDGTEVLVWLR